MPEQTIYPMTVVDVCPLTEDIMQLKVRPADPFLYTAGQYVLLGLEAEDLKPFSIANAPREDGILEFHIRQQPNNDWMLALFDIKPFETLYVQGPKDQYQLNAHNDRDLILVAGGTGFAPMKALLEALLVQNETHFIEFYWGVRQAKDLYEHEQMLTFCQQYSQLNYIPVVSDEASFQGMKGIVHQVVLENHPDLSSFRVYVCGPWPMQEAAKKDFQNAGLPSENFN